MELQAVGRLIKTNWFSIECELDALSLILVQLAAAKFFLPFLLKCDDHESDKNVHHEESDDDDIDDVIDPNQWTIV